MVSRKKTSILLVDDTETNIDVLVDVLGDEYELLVATDGPSALEVADEFLPDLVLLDVMMPGMDGFEVCEKLKGNPKTEDIPIVFVTAKTDVQDEVRGFELGAVDFISKPISPPVVKMRVESTLALKDKTDRLAALSSKLGKYLSPQVYESIFSGAQDVRVGGGRKKLTVFISDIVDFTATTDRMEPEDMTILLNSYLDTMSRIAMRHGGTIDKFIGDSILIFFGDPVSKGVYEDAMDCVNMALEMQEAQDRLRVKWADMGVEKPFSVRTGINTGYCTVGNFGSKDRMDYTIIGGQVNVAARLEQVAEPNQILLSHSTWALVKDTIQCLPKAPIRVKGIHHAIRTYQIYKGRRSSNDTAQSVISFVHSATLIQSTAPLRDVAKLLRNASLADAAIIVEGGTPVGILTKNHLELCLCSEADKAIFMDQPVSEIMDDAPVVLESTASLLEAGRMMSRRGGMMHILQLLLWRATPSQGFFCFQTL